MKVSDYIHEHSIVFLQNSTKAEVLEVMIKKASELGYINDVERFTSAIEEREARLSTGIGDGIAIPHAKIQGIEHFFVITAFLTPSVGWDALDQKPVSMVFMIGGPEDSQTTYLQLLAKLMKLLKNQDNRAQISRLSQPGDIVSFIAQNTK